MHDASALLAAIASNPDDDLPRLVYADWLDEHGDGERAEFIRLQCHTARVGPLAPTWAPAKLREYDLFKANETAWRTPTASDEGRMFMDRWRRGFPAEVMLDDVARGRLTSGEWGNGVYDWSADPNQRYDPWPGGPVREVTFSGWDDECGDLLWHPRLQGVRSLSLREWYAGVGTRRVESFVTDLSLLTPGHFPELTTLSFGDGELNLNALETLADSAVLETVTHLSLNFPEDIPAGELADWLAAVVRLLAAVAPRLESLSLEAPAPGLLPAFAAADWPHLTALNLSLTYADDITALPPSRPPRLRQLRMFPSTTSVGRVWTDDGVDHLARWTATGGVKELCVFGIRLAQFGRLLNRLNTPELEKLVVFDGSVKWSESSVADLTERDVFANLKNLSGPFTNAALAPLADPDVLPELHTIWGNETEPLTSLRWRGGVRTVIPEDPPDSWRVRPSRGSWCSG